MRAVMTVLVGAAGVLVLLAAAFLIGILRSPSSTIEVVAGCAAMVAAVVALAASLSVYRKVKRPV